MLGSRGWKKPFHRAWLLFQEGIPRFPRWRGSSSNAVLPYCCVILTLSMPLNANCESLDQRALRFSRGKVPRGNNVEISLEDKGRSWTLSFLSIRHSSRTLSMHYPVLRLALHWSNLSYRSRLYEDTESDQALEYCTSQGSSVNFLTLCQASLRLLSNIICIDVATP